MLFRGKCLAVLAIVTLLSACGIADAQNSDDPIVPKPTVISSDYAAHLADIEHFGAALKQSQEDRWWAWAAVQEWNKAIGRNWLAAKAALDAAERPARARQSVARSATPDAQASNGRHYLCPQYASGDNPTGDFAVPCYIIGRESHGSYTADNPHSSAYGAYQIMHLPPGTPPAEQDAIARGMALCNWNPPNYCAG